MKVFKNSHQPYLFKHKNKNFMAFCKKEKIIKLLRGERNFEFVVWNIYIKDLETNIDKKIFSINDRIECNPSIFYENGEAYLSFIASVSINNDTKLFNYQLKKIKIDENFNLISEEEDVMPAMSGFETDKKIYSFSFLSGFEYIFEIDKEKCTTISLDISSITNQFGRVIPIYNSSNYIITDSLTQRSFFIENNHTFNPKQIKNKEGKKVYKCSILDNIIAYALKTGEFEDRDIVIEEGYILE